MTSTASITKTHIFGPVIYAALIVNAYKLTLEPDRVELGPQLLVLHPKDSLGISFGCLSMGGCYHVWCPNYPTWPSLLWVPAPYLPAPCWSLRHWVRHPHMVSLPGAVQVFTWRSSTLGILILNWCWHLTELWAEPHLPCKWSFSRQMEWHKEFSYPILHSFENKSVYSCIVWVIQLERSPPPFFFLIKRQENASIFVN